MGAETTSPSIERFILTCPYWKYDGSEETFLPFADRAPPEFLSLSLQYAPQSLRLQAVAILAQKYDIKSDIVTGQSPQTPDSLRITNNLFHLETPNFEMIAYMANLRSWQSEMYFSKNVTKPVLRLVFPPKATKEQKSYAVKLIGTWGVKVATGPNASQKGDKDLLIIGVQNINTLCDQIPSLKSLKQTEPKQTNAQPRQSSHPSRPRTSPAPATKDATSQPRQA